MQQRLSAVNQMGFPSCAGFRQFPQWTANTEPREECSIHAKFAVIRV